MNPLQALHLSSGDTLEDAKKNFRILSLKFHPDKNPNDSDAPNKFREICEAIRYIEDNPKILGQIKQRQSKGFILTQLNVRMEDIYFYNELNLTVERLVCCKKCNGTGCEDKITHDCTLCNGEGHINSNVLKMMNKSSICPNCNGTGIDSNNLCKKCFGTKRISELKTYKVKVGINDYEKGAIVLKNSGNENSKEEFGDIHVNLNFLYDSVVKLEEIPPLGRCFVVYAPVRPVQRIIGDEGSINIFGTKIRYTIFPNEYMYVAKDKRPPNRSIYFKFTSQPPIVTPETRELYEKIRELERNYLGDPQ